MGTDVRVQARRWMAEDPDPDTRRELQVLLDLDDLSGLADRFESRLQFGTAGIRGTMGAGPNRMNRALVRRVSAGLAARLLQEGAQVARRGVVVGRDARHKSDEFAADAARVLAGAGLTVHQFPDVVPTPLLAFAVRHLNAAAGVQITASHNPPSDNGYKVYWGDGAQIVPPLDAEVAAAIDAVEHLADVALAAPDDPCLRRADDDVRHAYLDRALRLALHPELRELRIVYTPLHGVAGGLCTELLTRAGFDDLHIVDAQADADPDFPTVAFPNPEEPGALDLALALARDVRADLALANDPDGDRIAVAVPTENGWWTLSGDEVGALLADYLLTQGTGGRERLVATTVVSSQLLARMAREHRVGYAETLTGFKWLARVALDASTRGRRMVLAYEQALGVMVDTVVYDKDGLTAALLLADLAAWLRAHGRSLSDALDDLARRFGVHANAGRSLRLDGAPDLVEQVLSRLRTHPPAQIGGVAVLAVADHAEGVRRRSDGTSEPLSTPRTDLVAFTLADGSRLQVRPSGTEPLLKFYAEVIEPVDGDGDIAPARARAAQRLTALADAFLAHAAPG